MKNILIILLACTLSTVAFSDGHKAHEKSVLAALDKYFAARNSGDFATVVALESASGTYNTNSDGSFHKPVAKTSQEDWESTFQQGTLTQVHYPEAAALSDDVVLVRFYAEGMISSGGKASPYRTRVTMTWVKEKGGWVVKSSHYSSAAYGGVHKTQARDFED